MCGVQTLSTAMDMYRRFTDLRVTFAHIELHGDRKKKKNHIAHSYTWTKIKPSHFQK